MIRSAWTKAATAWWTVLSASFLPVGLVSAQAIHSATQPAARTLRQYVDELAARLRSRDTAQPDRDEAARRLAEINTADSRAALTAAILGADEKAALSSARALPESSAPEAGWIEPLARMLDRDATAGDAARALACYDGNPRAYDALIQIARSNKPVAVRLPSIRSLGEIIEKPVAEALISILNGDAEDVRVRAAAAEAIEHLSGQSGIGQDPSHRSRWWNDRKTLNPGAWRGQVASEQHVRLAQDEARLHEQLRDFRAAVEKVLSAQYARQASGEKPNVLLGYLDNADAGIRQIGATLVQQAVFRGEPVTQQIHRRLIELVGDSSSEVRAAIAQALSSLADPNALDAMLIQLQVESNVDVTVALCQAVAKIPSTRSVSVLRQLLNGSPMRVAIAAANALRSLAPQIQGGPGQAPQVFGDLHRILERRTGRPGNPNAGAESESLRLALVSAMASLANRTNPAGAIDIFAALLSQNESAQVRAAALEGLGQLGEAAADTILPELDQNTDPDPKVRAAAARALGLVGSFAYAPQLDSRTLPQNEPDPVVRQQARIAFQGLLTRATPEQLHEWAQRLKRRNDLQLEIVVLQAAARKLADRGDLDALAMDRQTLGELFLNQGEPAQAVAYFRPAFDYWRDKQSRQRISPRIVDQLVVQLVTSLLQSKQYHEAAVFAAAQISSQPAYQEDVGPPIRDMAQKLIQAGAKDPGSYNDAARLIKEALGMNPPLDEGYQQDLRTLQQQLPPGAGS